MADNSDITIIGYSFAAAISGGADVVLLEAEEVFGYHTTGRLAAMYELNYGNSVINALTHASHDAFVEAEVLSLRGVMTVADESKAHLMGVIADQEDNARMDMEEARALVPILDLSIVKDIVVGLSPARDM